MRRDSFAFKVVDLSYNDPLFAQNCPCEEGEEGHPCAEGVGPSYSQLVHPAQRSRLRSLDFRGNGFGRGGSEFRRVFDGKELIL